MPTASYSARRPVSTLAEATDLLREKGLRVSASRRIILEGLLAADGPVSAEYLAAGRSSGLPECDLPSAYRNLDLFEQLGMVRHVHIGHSPGLYALVGDDDPTYLVCEWCGNLDRLPPSRTEMIKAAITAATGFEAHFTHFPILGLCERCAAGDPSASDEAAATARGRRGNHEHSHGDHVHSHPPTD